MIQIAVKMLLSGTLLVLAILCMWEICRIWLDRSLVLAPFDYMESGKPSSETGEQFARMVRVEMVRLASLYGVNKSASTAALPSTDQIGRAESVEIPAVFVTTSIPSNSKPTGSMWATCSSRCGVSSKHRARSRVASRFKTTCIRFLRS